MSRQVANPAFHRSMPLELFGELTNALFRVMDTMDATVDFLELMTRFTLDAIGRAGFGMNEIVIRCYASSNSQIDI